MKALQEVFGRVDAPAINAAQLLEEATIKSDQEFQDPKGEVLSFAHLKDQMNELTMSMISLGVVAGDKVLIHALGYRDALLVFLAAEQLGVNVINLGEQPLEIVPIKDHRARLLIASKLTEGFSAKEKEVRSCEFLVERESSADTMSEALSWNQFTRLSKYTTEWELERFRVIEA